MSENPLFPPADSDGDADYRSLSGLAVASLVLALLSPLALADSLLLFLPLLGILLSFVSLSRIAASDGELTGAKVAAAACVLSVFFASASVARDMARQKLMSRQAQEAAFLWFDELRHGRVDEAMKRTLPESGDSITGIAENLHGPDPLREFARRSDIRLLSTLGEQATVRFYEESSVEDLSNNRQVLQQYYAVTFTDREGRRRTFFEQLTMERSDPDGAGLPRWRVSGYQGAVRPPGHALN